jgi:hypothetical protein
MLVYKPDDRLLDPVGDVGEGGKLAAEVAQQRQGADIQHLGEAYLHRLAPCKLHWR